MILLRLLSPSSFGLESNLYAIIEHLQDLAKRKQATVAQISLAWLLHQPHVTSVILGAKNMEQFKDNINSVNLTLTDEELATLNEVSKLTPESPRWMIQI